MQLSPITHFDFSPTQFQEFFMETQTAISQNLTEAEAVEHVSAFIAKYNLPTDVEIYFDADTSKTTVIWRGDANMNQFKEQFPDAFHKNDWLGSPVQKVKFEFMADQSIQLETVFFGHTSWEDKNLNYLVQKGVVSCREDSLEIQIDEVIETADEAGYDW